MQKAVRVNESQLLYLSSKAKQENTKCGYLHKKSVDTGKWQQRYFILYQNLLFYYENDQIVRPSGVALLEGSYCDRVITPGKGADKQYCFAIYYRREGQQSRQYDMRAETEAECSVWVDAIKQASFSKVVEQKECLEKKHSHLLQILESERQAKWHYVQQTEELSAEVKQLKCEMKDYKRERRASGGEQSLEEEGEEIRKIKKVQSFFRGWLCRRRWKQIVDKYIRSEHAESMRKRNSIVFRLVEQEEEYVQQLSALVTVFLRPLRMAASSKKPPITHEDVNSIFLNAETVLFLHQIFLKGLMARMENWPTLVLGDLFDMLLPMLGIYQEYVRNHHYSLQVLAEYKQKPEFNMLLRRYEEKSVCEGRTLDQFLTYPMHQLQLQFQRSRAASYAHAADSLGLQLPDAIKRASICSTSGATDSNTSTLEQLLTYPMHQIPRYIITIHELLAHTPHDHVERKSLEYAQSKLEELSQIMQDEVSETENIRKNLAIERMIVEGCDILLDVNQTFVRQGTLIQVINEPRKNSRTRLGSFSSTFKESKKEAVRQVFLFTNHMLLTTRGSSGRLHLAKNEDISSWKKVIRDSGGKTFGKISLSDCTLVEDTSSDTFYYDEEDYSNVRAGDSLLPTAAQQDKADYNGLDFRLIVDNRTQNGQPWLITLVANSLQEKAAWCSDISSCIENLHYSDLLQTSMAETSAVTMPQQVRSDPKLFRDDIDIKFSRTLNSCKVPQIRHATVERLLDRLTDLRFLSIDFLNTFLLTYRVFTSGSDVICALRKVYHSPIENAKVPITTDEKAGHDVTHRHSFDHEMLRNAAGSPPSNFHGRLAPKDNKLLIKPQAEKVRRISTGGLRIEVTGEKQKIDVSGVSSFTRYDRADSIEEVDEPPCLYIPTKAKLAPIASCETLSDQIQKTPEHGSSSGDDVDDDNDKETLMPLAVLSRRTAVRFSTTPPGESSTDPEETKALKTVRRATSPCTSIPPPIIQQKRASSPQIIATRSPVGSPKTKRPPSPISYSFSSPNMIPGIKHSTDTFSPRTSFACPPSDGSPPTARAGAVVTSSRASKRRSSSTAATAAFAAATAASSTPPDVHRPSQLSNELKVERLHKKRESVLNTAATMRVLNVIRHWVSKFWQDLEHDDILRKEVQDLLEEMVCNTSLLPAEHKAAASILKMCTQEQANAVKLDLNALLASPLQPTKDSFESLSALDIAEQMTFLDHKIFVSIRSMELLSQAWMKDKEKAPHVLLVSKRFNDMSRLVVSEIVSRANMQERVACIEKWAAIGDICRCMHNYNGVLQICAALVNSSVYRLKKTWDRIPKATKVVVEKLQNLVSSEGRFKNMRDALHRSDPPCIPYLGMYLTDLSFIEEGTPNKTEEELVNFSKMRMIAHVIREIQQFQNTPYRIEHHKRVTNYILDTSKLLDDDSTYKASLAIEPRQARISVNAQTAFSHRPSLGDVLSPR